MQFPVAEKAGYAKFRNPASRYALVGVFVAESGTDRARRGHRRRREGVFRSTEMEAALAQELLGHGIARRA